MAFPAGVFFGIQSHAGAYIKKVSKSKKVDRKDLLTSQGEIGVMHPYKTRTEFSVEGSGTLTVDTGIGASGLTGLNTGGTVIEDVTVDETQEDFGSWKYSGVNAPGAVVG